MLLLLNNPLSIYNHITYYQNSVATDNSIVLYHLSILKQMQIITLCSAGLFCIQYE